ncbi:MAG: helix-turn-helix domain-containing protein [Acutalibacteraceae bacterium]
MKLGNKLKALIEEKNITQKDLAATLNIAPSTISSYVQNMREPDFDTLKKIAIYFDVSVDYLLDMPNQTTDKNLENELLRVFRSIPIEQREIFVEQGKVFVKMKNRHKVNDKSQP